MKDQRPLTLIYLGSLVPDTAEFDGPAYSRAGNLAQLNLLRAVSEAGLTPSVVLSQQPLQLFPRSSAVFRRATRVALEGGLEARLVPFLNLPVLRPLTVGSAMAFWILRSALGHNGTDVVVYTFNLTEPPGLFTWLAARMAGAYVVAWVNDVNVPGHIVPTSLARRLDYWLQRMLLPRFDGLVVVSDRIAKDLAPTVPSIRVEGGVTPAMLDVGRRRSDNPPAPSERFTMVAAGSLNPHNGIAEIVGAMQRIPGDGYRLRVAGAGPLRAFVEAAAREDHRIEYWGYLPLEQVLDLYLSADVVINMRITNQLNTLYFFPSKMMELLASGVPVITTCPANVQEEFADFVFTLEEDSAEALARKIQEVARLPLEVREAKGRAARTFMATHRTWAAQGRRIVEFLRERIR